jgi:UDP-2,4-diacetamido-2,4,6-trideoxy-beta-L-altropyranose hydrolase
MPPKKILIRCDSSSLIGSGHVMRCLSLANKLRISGHVVEFAARNLTYNINNAIEKKQFKLWLMNAPKSPQLPTTDESKWLEVNMEEEVSEFNHLLSHIRPDWVIVDHYALDQEWEANVQKSVPNLLVIDDLFRNHQCTHLLDQNYHTCHAQLWQGKIPKECQTFLGPQYALLNDEFLKIPPKNEVPKVQNILAFFGGSDIAKASELFIETWKKINLPEVKAHLIIGQSNPRQRDLFNISVPNLKITPSSPDFYHLMVDTDLYIGASGSTVWERTYLGVPGITIAIAKNQIAIARELMELGVHEYLGEAMTLSTEEFASSVLKIVSNDQLRHQFMRNSLSLQVSSKIADIISSI